MNTRRSISLALAGLLLLCACGKTADTSTQTAPIVVTGARTALMVSVPLMRQSVGVVRPSPLFGIYAGLLLAGELAVPVTAAREGITVQLAMHALPTDENVDTLYGLLQELGAVLHVDIPDLLNRSDDRASTLDEYLTGLSNITERAKRRAADVDAQIANLKQRDRDQKATVSSIDKEIKNAVKANDYATAQDRQQALSDARSELTETESLLKEMTNIQSIFKELIGIATDRFAALNQNREVLIAGLKVIDLPGVEDLGVLESKTKRRSGGVSPFGGL